MTIVIPPNFTKGDLVIGIPHIEAMKLGSYIDQSGIYSGKVFMVLTIPRPGHFSEDFYTADFRSLSASKIYVNKSCLRFRKL